MLTELDTSQIIRSYIGLELSGVDGNVSTSDDAASSLTASHQIFHSALDVSSSTSDYEDDDVSLHIRDEACQTGDDDDDDDNSTESRLVGRLPVLRTRPLKLDGGVGAGIPVSADEEQSVWRTLLHNDDSYNDVVAKYEVPFPSAAEFPDDRCSPGPDGDAAATSYRSRAAGGDDCSLRGATMQEMSLSVVRSHSDSSLLSSSSASSASQSGDALSLPGVATLPMKLQISAELTESAYGRQTNARCSSVTHMSVPDISALSQQTSSVHEHLEAGYREEKPASGTPVSDVIVEDGMESTTFAQSLLAQCHSSSTEEDTVIASTSTSDVSVAVESEQLPGDAVSTTTDGNVTPNPETDVDLRLPDLHLPRTRNQLVGAERTRGRCCSVYDATSVTCIDYEACGLVADFVAHL